MGFAPGFLHPSGALLVDDSGLIAQGPGLLNFVANNGLKLNNAGQLVMKQGGTVHHYNGGLPVTATDELCVSFGVGAGGVLAGTTPALDLDFTAMGSTLDPRITFTRTTQAWYFDASLNLVNAAINVPRLPAYDPATGENLGFLIEAQGTQLLMNSTAVGAVAGTPGTAPNLWVVDDSGNGLTRTIVGTGQENGIDYVDIRYQGTPVDTGIPLSIQFSTLTAINGAAATVLALSSFLRLMAGSLANLRMNLNLVASDGVSILAEVGTTVAPTGAPLRTYRPNIVSNFAGVVGMTKQSGRIKVDLLGGPVDFTLRIGNPQQEGNFVTSPIKSTVASVTRTLDAASMTGTNFTDWYVQGPGTMTADFTAQNTVNTVPWALSDGTAANLIKDANNTFNNNLSITNASAAQAAVIVNTPNKPFYPRYITASAWATNDVNFSLNGQLGTKDVAATIPVTLNRLNVGANEVGGSTLTGWLRRLTYYSQRLDDAALVTATEATFHVGGVLVSNSSVRIIRN